MIEFLIEYKIKTVFFTRLDMVHSVTVQPLTYLFKGGRLSATATVAGSVVDVNPIIMVDENGSLKLVETGCG